MSDHLADVNKKVPPIRYTGLLPLTGAGMMPLVWTTDKPTILGTYWRRDKHGKVRACEVSEESETGARIFVDCESEWDFIDRPDLICEWAGPIPQPEPTMQAQHFYRVEEVDTLLKAAVDDVESLVRMTALHKITDIDAHAVIHRLLAQLRGGA